MQAELGTDVSVSFGSVNSLVRASETLDEAASQRMLSDDEKRAILVGGANLGLDPPAVVPHLGVAYSPLEHWELGVRFAASGWRVDITTHDLSDTALLGYPSVGVSVLLDPH